jgi:hypothetical protein
LLFSAARRATVSTHGEASIVVVSAAQVDENVIPWTATQSVIAASAHHDIVLLTSHQEIISAAEEYVISSPADERDTPVRSRRTQDVVAGPALNDDRQLNIANAANAVATVAQVDLVPQDVGCFEDPVVTAIGQKSAYLRLLGDMDSEPKPCL